MTVRIRFVVHVIVLAISLTLVPRAFSHGATAPPDAHARVSAGSQMRQHPVRVRRPRPSSSDRVVRVARRLLGVPYRYGGSSPQTGFDCSGFVTFVYRHVGILLPHSSFDQFRIGRSISRRALRPGDLVFFDGVGHVGIYVGRGRFIHAPHSGSSVRISSLGSSWYRSRYEGARRPAHG
jgi:cell wall-associated NlpC family hydrolase